MDISEKRNRLTPSTAWFGLALLMIPVFMTALDMTVLFLAIPTIAADLLPSGTQQLWVLHVGDIAGASLVLTAGRLVDRFGPRRLLIGGIVLYGIASILAAFSPTVETLILARMFLGASAVTVTPAGMALLRRMFTDTRSFSMAVSFFMAAFSGGMAMGPPVGGLLLENFWWGSIFIVNAPIALIVAALAFKVLPNVEGDGKGRIDVLSILLSAGGIGATVFGAQELAAGGWNVWHGLAVTGGIALLVMFALRQRVLRDPLLDLGIFRSLSLTFGALAMFMVITATAGADLQFAQLLQVVKGHSPLSAGLLLAIPALGSMVATASSPVLLRVFSPGHAIFASAMVGMVGAAGMVFLLASSRAGSTPLLILMVMLIAVGIAPVFAIATNIIMTNAPASMSGSAQAMGEVSGGLGNTAGIALGGSVAYIGYSSYMRQNVPNELSTAESSQSIESVGGAIALSQTMLPEDSANLMGFAREAFTLATRDAYWVAIVGLAVVGAIAFWGLRDARVDLEEEVGSDQVAPGLVPAKVSGGDLDSESQVIRSMHTGQHLPVRVFAASLDQDRAMRLVNEISTSIPK